MKVKDLKKPVENGQLIVKKVKELNLRESFNALPEAYNEQRTKKPDVSLYRPEAAQKKIKDHVEGVVLGSKYRTMQLLAKAKDFTVTNREDLNVNKVLKRLKYPYMFDEANKTLGQMYMTEAKQLLASGASHSDILAAVRDAVEFEKIDFASAIIDAILPGVADKLVNAPKPAFQDSKLSEEDAEEVAFKSELLKIKQELYKDSPVIELECFLQDFEYTREKAGRFIAELENDAEQIYLPEADTGDFGEQSTLGRQKRMLKELLQLESLNEQPDSASIEITETFKTFSL